jgi:hypothetical protein
MKAFIGIEKEIMPLQEWLDKGNELIIGTPMAFEIKGFSLIPNFPKGLWEKYYENGNFNPRADFFTRWRGFILTEEELKRMNDRGTKYIEFYNFHIIL